MAQASSSWQQIINQIPNWNLKARSHRAPIRHFQGKLLRRWQGSHRSLAILAGTVAVGIWDWKLLLASGAGIGTMVFVYSLQARQWQKFWCEVYKFIYSPNRRILVAVLGGGIATISSYMAASTWLELNSHWAAIAIMIQGMATVLVLILLVWLLTSIYGRDAENKLDEILSSLSHPDPIQRLVAIRQITKYVEQIDGDRETKQTIIDCLHLLLTREDEKRVRAAAFASLQVLDISAEPGQESRFQKINSQKSRSQHRSVNPSPNISSNTSSVTSIDPQPLKPLKITEKQQISIHEE